MTAEQVTAVEETPSIVISEERKKAVDLIIDKLKQAVVIAIEGGVEPWAVSNVVSSLVSMYKETDKKDKKK